MGAMTPVQALLASGVMSGAASLGSGIYASNSAAANNSTALAFNKWSQLNAQEFQRSMYNTQKLDQIDFYKKYQSPQAIAEQLSKLGVNPAGVFSQGSGINTSTPSMPSGISSPALSAPSLENEGKAMADSIQAIGSSLASIAQAGQTNEQSAEYLYTFNERVSALMLQNQGQKFSNNFAQWNLVASQAKLPFDIQKLAGEAYVDFTQGEVNESLTKLNKIAEYVRDNLKDVDIQYGNELLRLIGEQILDVSASANLKNEQALTEPSKRASNFAVASNQREQAKTEKDLRTERESALKLLNRVRSVEAEKSEATKEQSIKSLLADYARNSAVSSADSAEASRRLAILHNIEDHTSSEFMRTLDGSIEWLKEKVPALISVK